MLLLDTHAWLWARSSPNRLSAHARSLIKSEPLCISAISCWEVATLVRLGRIELDRDIDTWIGRALAEQPTVSVVPVSREIATVAGQLDSAFPGDPADRIIFSTAIQMKCSLLTKDRKLRSFSKTQTVWNYEP